MSLRAMTCIEDLRQTARRKVPRAFFDYAEAEIGRASCRERVYVLV